MFDSLKSGALSIVFSLSMPIAQWAGKKLLRLPPPTDKEGFREWLIWVIDNRLLSVVQQTPFDFDDKAITILRDVLDSDILFSLVWEKIHGTDPAPNEIETKSFLQRIKDRLAALKGAVLSSDDSEVSNFGLSVEEDAEIEKEAESVAVVVGILTLIFNAPQTIKNLSDILDYFKNKWKK